MKKGMRKKKQGDEQRYYCKTCQKWFVLGTFQHKTYHAEIIRDALSLYNQGLTFRQTATTLNRRFKVHTTPSSVQRWNAEFKNICTYSPLRSTLQKHYGNTMIVAKNFKYQGLAYNFKYHRGKLDLLCDALPSLLAYIQRCETGCPQFFNTIQNRCSQVPLEVTIEKTADMPSADILLKQTAVAVSSYPTKKKRHSLVENFLLVNDCVTVAVEVPVWLWEKNLRTSIAGHIDLIQIHDDTVYILDYKPDAAHEQEEQVASQLYLYSSGLSFRTKIPLTRIRCAWFDEHTYVAFEPHKAHVHYTKTTSPSHQVP